MLLSSVSSYLFQIQPAYKSNAKKLSLSNRFSGEKDIIDIITENLKSGIAFDLSQMQFGEGTAADKTPSNIGKIQKSTSANVATTEALSEKNFGLTTDTSAAKIKLDKIVKKDVVCDTDGTRLYKYVLFSVSYGENGDRGSLEKSDGSKVDIAPSDYYCRIHHVLLAFLDDDEAPYGIAYFEARGAHSIITPMKKVIQCAVRTIDGIRYSLKIDPYAEDKAVYKLINTAKLQEIALIKGKASSEVEGAMNYSEQRLVFVQPESKTIRDMLKNIYKNGKANLSSYEGEEFEDLKKFNPDEIKFKLTAHNGRDRTFTAGKTSAGVMQEVLPADVIGADGYTKPNDFLKILMDIIREQHISN